MVRDAELDRPQEGALTEPETVAKDVAPEGEQVADSETSQTPESVPYKDFQALQSKYDKRQAELEREIKALKANRSPDITQDRRRRSELEKTWEESLNALAQAEQEGDARTAAMIGRSLTTLEDQLLQTDLRLEAAEAGIDPNDPQLQEMINSGQITNPSDLRAAVWRVKATSSPESIQSNSIAEREAALAEREANIESAIAKAVAQVRQELGANRVPGVSSQGAPTTRSQLERELDEAKSDGRSMDYLRIKRQLNNLRE